MKKELTCIVCPMGCQLKVEMQNDDIISVEGNTCPRGEKYASTELINPMRVITTTIRTKDGNIVPVKTDGSVAKASMFECMEVINGLHPDTADCGVGSIVCENVLNSGVNVVVTAPVNRR